MDFTAWQDIWAQQPESAPRDVDEELRTVVRRTRQLNRRVAMRDYVELLTAVGMSTGFVWMATLAPVTWPWLTAAAITLGVGLVFARERIRPSPASMGPGNVRHGLQQAVKEVDHQVRLLGSVARWYLAPLAVVALLIIVGTALGVRQEAGPEAWARGRAGLAAAMAVLLPVLGAIFWWVGWLNRRVVETQLLPHREQLASLLAQLDQPDQEA